jgi:hypothetical protein
MFDSRPSTAGEMTHISPRDHAIYQDFTPIMQLGPACLASETDDVSEESRSDQLNASFLLTGFYRGAHYPGAPQEGCAVVRVVSDLPVKSRS